MFNIIVDAIRRNRKSKTYVLSPALVAGGTKNHTIIIFDSKEFNDPSLKKKPSVFS